MKKNIKHIFLIVFTFFSCNIVFSKDETIDVIPFDFEGNNIIINVTINNKNFNFLFSTGGYSYVSKEIIEYFNLQIDDLNLSSQFYVINKLKIGNTFFSNSDFKSFDVNQNFGFKCRKIDGILGANILSKKVCKIDYIKKQISISDSIDNFEISKNAKVFDFKTDSNNLSPMINLIVDNVKFTNIKVSTGVNGSINLPIKNFKKLISKYKNVKYTGTEIFSVANKVVSVNDYAALIPINIWKNDLEKVMVNFNDSGVSQIGNLFLKDYTVTFDWKNKKLYLDEHFATQNYKIEDYGFYFYKRYGSIEVVGYYENSNADKQGIKNGDLILKINDIDFTKISDDDLCDLYFKFKDFFNNETLNVKVLRGTKELSFNISKQILLDNLK